MPQRVSSHSMTHINESILPYIVSHLSSVNKEGKTLAEDILNKEAECWIDWNIDGQKQTLPFSQ